MGAKGDTISGNGCVPALLTQHLGEHADADAHQSAGDGADDDLHRVARALDPRVHLALTAPLERVAIDLLAAAKRQHLAVRDEVVLLLHAFHIHERHEHHDERHGGKRRGGRDVHAPAPFELERRPRAQHQKHDRAHDRDCGEGVVLLDRFVHYLRHGFHISFDEGVHGHPEHVGKQQQALDIRIRTATVSVRKSYDISELGLSEGAVRGLVTGAVDVQILNRLLEHRNFPKLIDLIRIYFQDTAAKGITARNQLIEIATASLSDLMKEHPEHRAEAKQDLQLLNAQKMGEHEAEIEKIKNVFLAILRDIKKDIDNGEQPGEAVTAAMFQAMRDALAEQKQNPLSIDDVAAMVAGQIGQLTPMDEETADLFKQLAKKMMKGIE